MLGKSIKKFLRISAITLGCIILLLAGGGFLLLQSPKVQTYLTQTIAGNLSNRFHTSISIGAVTFRPFNSLVLKNVFVADQKGDTLLFSKEIAAKLTRFSFKRRSLTIGSILLKSTTAKLHADSLGNTNFDFLVDALSSPSDTTTTTSESPSWKVELNSLAIDDLNFAYKQQNNDKPEWGVNYDDLRVNHLNLNISDLKTSDDSLSCYIDYINLEEKSGFKLDKLSGFYLMTPKSMSIYKGELIAGNTSLHLQELKFSYDSLADFNDFDNKIRMRGLIPQSVLDMKTLSYFVPDFEKMKGIYFIDLDVDGPVANLNAKKVKVKTLQKTSLETSFVLRGLPDIDHTLILCNIESLSSTPNEVETILNNLMPDNGIRFADNLQKNSPFNLSWSFNGYIENFVTFGDLSSAAGLLNANFYMKPQNKRTIFDGSLEFKELDAAKLLADTLLGKATARIKGKGYFDKHHVEANVDAEIDRLDLEGYSYGDILFNGKATENSFDGSIVSKDPNLKFNLTGKIDFSKELPVFDFSLFLAKANLYQLKLYDKDTVSLLSFALSSKISGNSLDNLNGEVSIQNPIYRSSAQNHKLGNIQLNAASSAFSHSLNLKSDMVDAELRGKYSFANISISFAKFLKKYLPALQTQQGKEVTDSVEPDDGNSDQNYMLKAKVKKAGSELLSDIVPGLLVGNNSTIFSIYNPVLQTVNIRARFPEIGLDDNKMKELTITAQTTDSLLEAGFSANQLDAGGVQLKQVEFATSTAKNISNFKISWDNQSEKKNLGTILGKVNLFEQGDSTKPLATVTFEPSTLTLNDTIWSIGKSTVDLDTNLIAIHNINLFNKHQSMAISGRASGMPKDSIDVSFNNIDISNINFLTEPTGYSFQGMIDGRAKLGNLFSSPVFSSNLYLKDLQVNDKLVGTSQIQSIWDDESEKLNVSVTTVRNDTTIFDLSGSYEPKQDNLNLNADIHSLMLERFTPFLTGVLSEPEGSLVGNISVVGKLSAPVINGTLRTNNLGFTVDYLNTHYKLNAPIEIQNGQVYIKEGEVRDAKGGTAALDASLTHNNFSDIFYKINLYPKNLLCLHTTQRENEQFYGTAYVSGTATISGKADALLINVNATTEKNTSMMIPLNSASEVSNSDFVTIEKPKTDEIVIEEKKQEEAENQMQLEINMMLNVNTNAEAQIIIDPKVGDIIKATGNGNLKMEINPNQNIFKIYGDYTIDQGDYLFTLQNVINKHFKIDNGSTLRWNGDASNANIDIKAVYKLKAALSDLLNDTSAVYKRRIPVECQILMSDKLTQPTIKFNIVVPGIDAETQGKVLNALNTDEKISKQFLSLLVINSFFPDMAFNEMQGQSGQAGQSFGAASVSVTASEFLSNQLSNWLSQLSKTFDVGFKYRPGDQVTNDEVEVAISTQLFNDRITVNGNVDMGGNNKTSGNGLGGDFDIEYKITPKLSVKGFTRSNDNLIYERSPNTQGIGISYREEFDNFGDLMNKIFGRSKAKKDKKNRPPADSTNREGNLPTETKVIAPTNADTTGNATK